MDNVSAAALIDYFGQIDIFLVIFVRFLAFMLVLPIFSGLNIPTITKIIVSLSISVLVMTSGIVTIVEYTDNIVGYFILLMTEFINGLIIGFVIYFMFTIFYFVGQIVDYKLGFSMVSVFDPVMQLQVPITGNLFYLMIMLFFIITGGLNFSIEVIFDSYKIIPIGHSNIITESSRVLPYIIEIMMKYIELGVLIALPIIGTIIIIDIALGLLVKAVPQMNIFVVGMPVKVFVGLLVLTIILPSLYEGYWLVFEKTTEYLGFILKEMSS